ncbi:hypothetical protein NGB36_01245 [Streptomyces sp. RB6PN25]|uniref:Integral membrane protein n=1 Tax=Streptomyces humicola TaxID=2953240 RepID=A0ABT1PNM1_9ACTN|nr:hypothetical protein [Streptomyces humicola]MCQ4079269.1 hypothetical protein [Streptomyces humicola]
MDVGQDSRAARAAMFAAVCVLLSALGHVMMSGVDIPWWALAAAFAAAGAVGWCCTGRERGPVFVTTFTVVTEFVLHSLFSLGQVAAEGTSSDGESLAQQWAKVLLCGNGSSAPLSPAAAERLVRAAGLGHQLSSPPPSIGSLGSMSSMPGMGSMGLMPSMGMSHMAGHGSTYGMLAAHLLAALLSGLWLAHGERSAFRIGRALAARLFAPLLLVIRVAEPPHRPRIRADRHWSTRRLRSRLLVHAITTRGPPRRIAVA